MTPTVTPPKPIDLHLRVTADRNRRGEQILVHQLTSPSGLASVYRLERESQPLGDRAMVRASMLDEVQQLLQGVYTDSHTWTLDRIESKLRSVGRNLFRRVFPRELQQTLSELAGVGGLSLQIESDTTDVPWEVLHTDDPEADFLCLRFDLARWLSQTTPPRAQIAAARILGVEAGRLTDSELRKPMPDLPGTREEIGLLRGFDTDPSSATIDLLFDAPLDGVREHLEIGSHDWIHFAGHSEFPPGRADRALLYLNGGNLEAQDLIGPIAEALGRSRPVVFLNSCRTGIQDRAVTGVGGWPQRFIDVCGCGAFIGPQWTVRNRSAFRFARSFYQTLQQEPQVGLGEAVRRARWTPRPRHALLENSEDPGSFDPSLLAYCFFGHPNAHLQSGPGAVMQDATKQRGVSKDEEGNSPRWVVGGSSPSIDGGARLSPGSDPEKDSATILRPSTREDTPMPKLRSTFRNTERGDGSSAADPAPAPRSSSAGGISVGSLDNNSGTVIMGGVSTTHIHKTDGPSLEEQRRDQALGLYRSGLRSLEVGDYGSAEQLFERVEEFDSLEGIGYLRAVTLLASRRPRVLPWSTLGQVETLLLRAHREGDGSHVALLLAYVKHDYYAANGRVARSPTVAELLAEVRDAPPDRRHLEELRRWTSIEGFLNRRAPWVAGG